MRILETCLYAEDLETVERFYRSLGFVCTSKLTGRHVFFRLEQSMLLIFNPAASAIAGALPPHAGRAGGHVCFAIEEGAIPAWQKRLIEQGIEVTRYTWSNARGTSLYFHDPAGNLLELAPPSIWSLGAIGPHDELNDATGAV